MSLTLAATDDLLSDVPFVERLLEQGALRLTRVPGGPLVAPLPTALENGDVDLVLAPGSAAALANDGRTLAALLLARGAGRFIQETPQ